MKRKLYLIGDVNEEMYREFTTKLAELEKENEKPVHVELSSNGGEMNDALAIAGRIRNSSVPIYITAYGKVQSAAVLIFASGDRRYAAEEAWFMTHQGKYSLKGELHECERQIKQAQAEEGYWCQLLEKLTGTSAMQWSAWDKETKYMTAKQAMGAGLVTEVLRGVKKSA